MSRNTCSLGEQARVLLSFAVSLTLTTVTNGTKRLPWPIRSSALQCDSGVMSWAVRIPIINIINSYHLMYHKRYVLTKGMHRYLNRQGRARKKPVNQSHTARLPLFRNGILFSHHHVRVVHLQTLANAFSHSQVWYNEGEPPYAHVSVGMLIHGGDNGTKPNHMRRVSATSHRNRARNGYKLTRIS